MRAKGAQKATSRKSAWTWENETQTDCFDLSEMPLYGDSC